MISPALFFFFFLTGFFSFYLIHKVKTRGFEKIGAEILTKSQQEAEKLETALRLKLKEKEFDFQKQLEQKATKEKEKLKSREEKLERQLDLIETKLGEISKREKSLENLELKSLEIEKKEKKLFADLEKTANLTQEEARQFLFDKLSKQIEQDAGNFLIKEMKRVEEEVEVEAARILATAINRLALPTVTETSTITVSLPNHEMKGRVIGREGRNIRALEYATGVSFSVDDTPNAIVISGFDPIRKEIAKQALKHLIQDGRIHPTRIEETVEKTRERVMRQIKDFGENAALRVGVIGLHPELLNLLGTLNFRFSFGQNLLEHSLEVSHLMGIMAAELGLDVCLSKRIGLLHDIGKAVSHEVEGSHALIGFDTALRCGESEAVANGIGCHHEEILPITIEGSLCEAADKISGGRPGARVEALDQTVKRAQKLEFLSSQFEGVEYAYALQAGKEIRVIVQPDHFDDIATLHLAKEIAKKIEHELSFPGKIKVTVIREKRAVEYAT